MPLQTCALPIRSEEHTSELQSHDNLVCRILLEKKTASGRPVSRCSRTGRHATHTRCAPDVALGQWLSIPARSSHVECCHALGRCLFFYGPGPHLGRLSFPPPRSPD